MDDLDVNERPAVDSAIADQTMTGGVFRIISLQGTFSDPDTGDTLSYSASSSNTGIATASVNGSTLTLEALSAGSATITVTAADRSSGDVDRMTVEQDFMVIVEARSPNQPIGLKAEAMIGGRGIKLEWDPADGAAGYEVEISPTASAHQIDITGIAGLSAEITGLTPGTIYTFKVLACNPCGASGLYSLPSIPIDFEAPEPTKTGHQADHTVKYEVRNIGNSVISDAIEPAASAWNFAMARLGKGLEICTGNLCVNPDGYTMTIKAVDNKNDALTFSDDIDEGCGPSRACVKSTVRGGHMSEMHMIFEDPPWFAQEITTDVWRVKEYVWTKDKYKNGKLIPCRAPASICAARYYVYAGRVMLHEFGHTLGLSDFYADTKTGLIRLPNAAMHMGFVITGEDLKQLEAIYLLHDPH